MCKLVNIRIFEYEFIKDMKKRDVCITGIIVFMN